jgi:hypothetical protein
MIQAPLDRPGRLVDSTRQPKQKKTGTSGFDLLPLPTMSASLSDTSVYIASFDRTAFVKVILSYLLPALVCATALWAVLRHTYYRLEFAASYFALAEWRWVRDARTFERCLPYALLGVWALALVSVALFFLFGIMVCCCWKCV